MIQRNNPSSLKISCRGVNGCGGRIFLVANIAPVVMISFCMNIVALSYYLLADLYGTKSTSSVGH